MSELGFLASELNAAPVGDSRGGVKRAENGLELRILPRFQDWLAG
jgi:hypothetical protein